MFDFIQRWFFDTEYSDEFKLLTEELNSEIEKLGSDINFEEKVLEHTDKIFTTKQKSILDKRILSSAYLLYLSGNKTDAGLMFSLYLNEEFKQKLQQNIVRKSVYEYYVSLKFRYKEEHKMTNIFAMKNKQKSNDLNIKQIESAIATIERLWTENE
jgi:hypothetical protein